MANQKVGIEFEGIGTMLDDLDLMNDGIRVLGTTHKDVSKGIQSDLAQSAQKTVEFGKNINAASALVVALARAAQQGLPALAKSLQQVADVASSVGSSLSKADKANFTQVNAGLREVAKNQGIIVGEVNKEKAARIAALVETKKITLEEATLLGEVQAVVDALKGAAEVPPLDVPVERVQTLRSEYLAAKRAAEALALTPGPEFDAALAEAARLKNILDNTGKSIQALNPGDKVAAFSQLGNAIAGGAQAISGFAIAFGGNNQELQQMLFKFQSALFAIQGAQTFLKDFKDSFENVRRVLGLTTIAQEVSTVATVADTTAKGGQAAANVTATATTGVLATAIKGLTAALLANPIIAIVAALAAIGIAMVALSADTKTTTENFQKLNDRIDRLIAKRQALRDSEKRRAELDAEADAIQNVGNAEEQRAAILKASSLEQGRIESQLEEQRAKAAIKRAEIEILQAKIREASNKRFNKEDADALREELKLVAKDFEDAKASIALLGEDNAAREKTLSNDLSRFDDGQKKEALDKAKQFAADTKAIREGLAADLLAIEKTLAEKIAALETEGLNPEQRLVRERQVLEKEFDQLEQQQRRIIALKEIGAAKLIGLTEAEQQARADARIADGGGQLALQQQQELNVARLLVTAKFERELSDLQLAAATERLGLLKATDATVREQFVLEQEARRRALIAAGQDEIEVNASVDRAIEDFDREAAQKRIELDTELQLAIVEGKKRGGETEKEFERQKQLEILAIRIAGAEASRALVPVDSDKENQLLRQNFQNIIDEATLAREKLLNTPKGINLLDLLGVKVEDQAAVNAALNSIVGSFVSAMSTMIAAQQAQVQGQIAATDTIIADQQRRRSELEGELSKEEDRREQGLSNNVSRIKEALVLVKKAEQEALAEKKRLQAEEARLARKQAAVNAITQGSNLITAATTLFAGEVAKGGIIGVVTAIAGLAAMFAAFVNFKASVDAAQENSMGEGGWIGGKSHSEGGTPMTAEKDEFVVKKKSAKKYNKIVEAINEDDWNNVSLDDLRPIFKKMSIALDDEEMDRVIEEKKQYINQTTIGANMRTEALEEKVEVLTEEVRGMRKDNRTRERVTIEADGTKVIERPGERIIIRPKR